jgi:O-antigen ligase
MKKFIDYCFFNNPNQTIEQLAKYFLIVAVFFMPISTAATNLAMFFTLAAWLFSGGLFVRWILIKNNTFVHATILIFFLLVLGSFYSTGILEDILYQLGKYAKILFILPAITLVQDEKWKKRGINVFCISMLITLILSIVSSIWPLSFVKGTAGGASINHFVFRDYIAQNLMMSFFVLIMFVRAIFSESNKLKILYTVIGLVAIYDILFLVLGRTGYISLALNLLVFMFFLRAWREKILALSIFSAIIIVTIVYSASFNSRINIALDEYKNHHTNDQSSVGQRIEFLNKSIELIKERPWAGFGTGAQRKELCRVANSADWCNVGQIHPHNQFMAIGIQLGVIGIGAYMFFMAAGIWQARLQRRDYKILGVGLVATLFVDSLFNAPLTLIAEAAIFILLFPIFVGKTSSDLK